MGPARLAAGGLLIRRGLTSAVLLGGKSTRFGKSKAFLPWKGKPLAARRVEALSPLSEEVLLVAKSLRQVPAQALAPAEARFVPDVSPHATPLAGFTAALAACRGEFLFLTAVDMPHMVPAVVQGLRRLLENNRTCASAAPRLAGRFEPFISLWRPARLPFGVLRSRWSFQELFSVLGPLVVPVSEETFRSWDPTLRSLVNLNQPKHWREASSP